jgi:hypothetical protein
MTRQLVRLYAVVFGLLVVLVAWAVVAAHPWVQVSAAPLDPRVRALEAREARLREDALVVERTVDRRWQAYRVRLHARQKAIVRLRAQHRDQLAAVQAAAASAAQAAQAPPPVRIVTAAPVTASRSS